ncbi:MAG: DHH family phosphoesterase [Bdellovibrionales bacterium]|nr:DHH family phosphoesterase [Bdellovibrionales bacterium]
MFSPAPEQSPQDIQPIAPPCPVQRTFKELHLREQSPVVAEEISHVYGLLPATSQILAARGFVPGEALAQYLESSPEKLMRDARLLSQDIKGLIEGVQLLGQVISEGGKIGIASDYDVDGLTGGVQIYRALRDSGIAVTHLIPDRFQEGYGLNNRIVDDCVAQGCKLLITVDYGTKSIEPIRSAQERGLKVIVIDHHAVESPPPADVFINPLQKDCGFAEGILCASLLAWYFVDTATEMIPKLSQFHNEQNIPYAGTGTICDMVPLRGPNRAVAKSTLSLLPHSSHEGLIALYKAVCSEQEVMCADISFGIGPRINAAGRMKDGNIVVELLTTDDPQRAQALARKLTRINTQRQETEEAVKDLAIGQLQEQSRLDLGIILADPDFHPGVVGLAAQRIMDMYHRPTIILGKKGNDWSGSVRGIPGFHVAEMIEQLEKLGLVRGGGHVAAGGLSFAQELLDDVRDAFLANCQQQLRGVSLTPRHVVDTSVRLSDFTPELVEELRLFEPLGRGNEAPSFMCNGLRVIDLRLMKNAHLRVKFSDGEGEIEGVFWRLKEHPVLRIGNRVNIAARPEVNNYRGSRIQLNLHAAEIAGEV